MIGLAQKEDNMYTLCSYLKRKMAVQQEAINNLIENKERFEDEGDVEKLMEADVSLERAKGYFIACWDFVGETYCKPIKIPVSHGLDSALKALRDLQTKYEDSKNRLQGVTESDLDGEDDGFEI